jgi:hypothetical protein
MAKQDQTGSYLGYGSGVWNLTSSPHHHFFHFSFSNWWITSKKYLKNPRAFLLSELSLIPFHYFLVLSHLD